MSIRTLCIFFFTFLSHAILAGKQNYNNKLTNIQITSNAATQSEPSIAIDPNAVDHQFVTFNDMGNNDYSTAGYAITSDGWVSKTVSYLPPIDGQPLWKYGYDPVSAFDPGGHPIYCFIASKVAEPNLVATRLMLARTTNDGVLWSQVVVDDGIIDYFNDHDGPYQNDKPSMVVDHTNGGDGTIYMAWTKHSQTSIEIVFARYSSSVLPIDGIETLLSKPIGSDQNYSPEGNQVNGVMFSSSVGVGPLQNGKRYVYVAYTSLAGNSEYDISVSTNGGASFDDALRKKITNYAPKLSGASIQMNNVPSMAVDPQNGYVYFAYAAPSQTTQTDWKVKLLRSTDNGSSWATMATYPESNSNDLCYSPGLAVDESGNVVLAFMRAPSLTNTTADYFMVQSRDHGGTFGDQIWITSVTSDQSLQISGNDYQAIAASGNKIVPAWADFRNYSSTGSDIYIENLSRVSESNPASWNLVGLPLNIWTSGYSSVYPSLPQVPSPSSGPLFYSNARDPVQHNIEGYFPSTDLETGKGYFVNLPLPTQALVFGDNIASLQMTVFQGWNLVSSISTPLDVSKIVVSPSNLNLSTFFGYGGPSVGYFPVTTLAPGAGYWVRSDQDGQIQISSGSTSSRPPGSNWTPPCPPNPPAATVLASPPIGSTGNSISGTLGWNAASCAESYHLQLSASSLFTNCLVDDPNLTQTARLVSGLSYHRVYYWRVAAANAYGAGPWSSVWYFVTEDSAPPPPCQCCLNSLSSLDMVSVTDAAGNGQMLYLANGGRESRLPYRGFDLPPTTPRGIFDARFASGKFLETVPPNTSAQTHFPIRIKDAIFPLTIRWAFRPENSLKYTLTLPGTQGQMKMSLDGHTGSAVIGGSDQGSLMLNVQPMNIDPCLPTTTAAILDEEILESDHKPSETRIVGNYPNPFNPATTLNYQLATPGKVDLAVYDLLGRVVTRLLEEDQQLAGYHAATWSPVGIPSGIYFVRLVVTDQASGRSFQNVRKLAFMK